MSKKRWLLVYSLFFVVMLQMGSVYTYSLYRPALITIYQMTLVESGIPYLVSLVAYALSMLVTGRWLSPHRTRVLITLGALLFSVGWFGASQASNIILFTLFYGVFMGWAVGILYGTALAMVQHYATHFTGWWGGILLMAFGLSTVILSPIVQHLLLTIELSVLFQYYGIISVLTTSALILSIPSSSIQNFDQKETIVPSVRKEFIILTLATFIGLSMIGITYSLAVDHYHFAPQDVAWAMSLFALFNALARPLFGWLMDRLAFYKSSFISISLLFIATIINLFNQGSSYLLFIVGYTLYWMNLGAWLAMMPILIKQRYGINLYGRLYGKVFLGYGVSAVIGTLVSSAIVDYFQSTWVLYVVLLVILFILSWSILQISTNQNQHPI